MPYRPAHSKKWLCSYESCNKDFEKKNTATRHEKNHEEGRFVCDGKCIHRNCGGKTFARQDLLECHRDPSKRKPRGKKGERQPAAQHPPPQSGAAAQAVPQGGFSFNSPINPADAFNAPWIQQQEPSYGTSLSTYGQHQYQAPYHQQQQRIPNTSLSTYGQPQYQAPYHQQQQQHHGSNQLQSQQQYSYPSQQYGNTPNQPAPRQNPSQPSQANLGTGSPAAPFDEQEPYLAGYRYF